MAKWGIDLMRKRVKLSAFNFDVHPGIVLGFALHWTWVWVMFWSQKFYSASPAPTSTQLLGLEPLWLLSILSNVLCYGGLFFIGMRQGAIGRPAVAALVAAMLTTVGTVLISVPAGATLADAGGAGYVLGALLTGVGSAIEVILWAELLTTLGARQVVVYSVLATLAGSVFFFVITLIPSAAAR